MAKRLLTTWILLAVTTAWLLLQGGWVEYQVPGQTIPKEGIGQ